MNTMEILTLLLVVFTALSYIENHKKKYDAKEKGNNEYQGQGQQKKKKRSNEKDGSVVLKAGNSHFDMKI